MRGCLAAIAIGVLIGAVRQRAAADLPIGVLDT